MKYRGIAGLSRTCRCGSPQRGFIVTYANGDRFGYFKSCPGCGTGEGTNKPWRLRDWERATLQRVT